MITLIDPNKLNDWSHPEDTGDPKTIVRFVSLTEGRAAEIREIFPQGMTANAIAKRANRIMFMMHVREILNLREADGTVIDCWKKTDDMKEAERVYTTFPPLFCDGLGNAIAATGKLTFGQEKNSEGSSASQT